MTPAHPPGPDFEGTIRLVEAVSTHVASEIDTEPLERQSEEARQYYQELVTRMQTVEDESEIPEDRMYM